MSEREPSNFTTSPCTVDGIEGHWSGEWMVWDMYLPMPPKPVFVGSMEEAGGVADALNARLRRAAPVANPQPQAGTQ